MESINLMNTNSVQYKTDHDRPAPSDGQLIFGTIHLSKFIHR